MLHLNLTFCAFNSESKIACRCLLAIGRNGRGARHCGQLWQRLVHERQPTKVQFEGQTTGLSKRHLQMPQVMKSFSSMARVPNASYGSVTEWKTSRRELRLIDGEVGIHCSEAQAPCGDEEDDMVGYTSCVGM